MDKKLQELMRLKEELDSKIAAIKDATSFQYPCDTYPKDKLTGTFKDDKVIIHTYGDVCMSKQNALEMCEKIEDWYSFKKDQEEMKSLKFPMKTNSTKSFEEFIDFSDGVFRLYRVSKEDGTEQDMVFTKTQLRHLMVAIKKITK